MIELRFHQELYDGFAVDEAVKAYAGFATAELVREEHGYLVKLTGAGEIEESIVAAELSNYALGKTIEKRGGP